MSAAHVQYTIVNTGSVNAPTASGALDNPVMAGNAIIVPISLWTGPGTGFSVSDDVNGSYTQDLFYRHPTAERAVAFFSRRNCAAGTTTVTVTVSGGDSTFDATPIEVSGLTSAMPAVSQLDQNATDPHYCADAAESLSGSGYGICVVAEASSVGKTPGTGWSELWDSTRVFMQEQIAVFVAERGAFSDGGTNATTAAIALYSDGGTSVLTGTGIGGISEGDLVAGGKTIVATLTNATWIPN